MTFFLLTVFFMQAVNVLATLILLANVEYPRERRTTRGSDVISILSTLFLMGWVAVLLWGKGGVL